MMALGIAYFWYFDIMVFTLKKLNRCLVYAFLFIMFSFTWLCFLATLLSAIMVSHERKHEAVPYCIYQFKLWKINIILFAITMDLCLIVGCGNKSEKNSQKRIL